MTPQTQISEAKLEANRRNAKHSRGPRTEQGKRISSHNSLRHGFTGRVNILTPENREAHDKFCTELIESLNPETPLEHQFAHSIAEDSWRLNGLRAAETNILAEAAAGSRNETEAAICTARAYVKNAKELQLMSLYEQRINRAIHKNLSQFQALEAERRARRQQALDEAKLLAQLDLLTAATAQGTSAEGARKAAPASAQVGGFVFSTAEINLAIDRDNRLQQARDLNSNHPATPKRQLSRAA
jgi:hypothetical protein